MLAGVGLMSCQKNGVIMIGFLLTAFCPFIDPDHVRQRPVQCRDQGLGATGITGPAFDYLAGAVDKNKHRIGMPDLVLLRKCDTLTLVHIEGQMNNRLERRL